MAKAYIAEFSKLKLVEGRGVSQIGDTEYLIAEQTVAIGAETDSNAFNAGTNFVRVHVDAICSIAFGESPTASTSTMRLAANQTEYFGVKPGWKISVVTNS